MDQNDIHPEKGEPGYRRIHKMEHVQYPTASIIYASIACLRCEDAPYVKGCMTSSITKNSNTNPVEVNQELCIGCRSCAQACPFGVPCYDVNNKMRKCKLIVDQ
jgi:Fe-S-cluster-containing dehydrogenase component